MRGLPPARRNIDLAREGHMRAAALRAVDDPAALAKAARIVRAGLQRGALKPEDLEGDIVKVDLNELGLPG